MRSISALPRCSRLVPDMDCHMASVPTHGAKWSWDLPPTDAAPEPAGPWGGVATRASGAWMLAPSSEVGICQLWDQCRGVWPGTTQCVSVCASQVLC